MKKIWFGRIFFICLSQRYTAQSRRLRVCEADDGEDSRMLSCQSEALYERECAPAPQTTLPALTAEGGQQFNAIQSQKV